MAVTLLQTWGGQQYPFGYVLRIDLSDGVRIYNRQTEWPTAPSAAQIDAAVADEIARIEASLVPPSAQCHLRCEDGTILDFYIPSLDERERQVDLLVTLTTQQQTAWGIIKPILVPHILTGYRVYARLDPDQQAAMKAHNPFLASVIDALEPGEET